MQFIPMATVAALLMYIAVRMVSAEHLMHMFHLDKVGNSLESIRQSLLLRRYSLQTMLDA